MRLGQVVRGDANQIGVDINQVIWLAMPLGYSVGLAGTAIVSSSLMQSRIGITLTGAFYSLGAQ